MKTILITGCSSGYGLAAARHFLSQGWRVVATMRTPRTDVLPASPNLRVLALDVTAPDSIARAIADAGPIDVLVNNAGIGLFGAFEATPMATVREVFETNTFGTMAMCQAVIPQFRARRAGMIVNVTSTTTLAPFPLVAAYTASKTAIDGFTASLRHELDAFDVQVKLVVPGYGPSTQFAANGETRMQHLIPPAYEPFAHQVFASFATLDAVTSATDVAEGIWRAVHDTTNELRLPAGADAVALVAHPHPSRRPDAPQKKKAAHPRGLSLSSAKGFQPRHHCPDGSRRAKITLFARRARPPRFSGFKFRRSRNLKTSQRVCPRGL